MGLGNNAAGFVERIPEYSKDLWKLEE